MNNVTASRSCIRFANTAGKEQCVRVLFIGDIVGRPGRDAVAGILLRWRAIHQPDIVLANGENAAAGHGITPAIAEELFHTGIDVITLGNHTFNKKEVVPLLQQDPRVLRPANYPPEVPGRGYGVYTAGSGRLGVISLMGRVFMDPLDDPFRAAQQLVALLREQTCCILVDIHAEATSEKAAMGWMLDGQVSAVVGTHSHVPTADARVLPRGTAFITDVGMAGPWESILGVKPEIIIRRFQTMMPARFEVADGPVLVSAVLIDIDNATGMASNITRIEEVVTLNKSER